MVSGGVLVFWSRANNSLVWVGAIDSLRVSCDHRHSFVRAVKKVCGLEYTCDFDDDLGQSMLVQQEQHTIRRENEQLCNSAGETDGRSESVEKSDNDGTTGWRCSYTNEEENTEDSIINNNSDLAG